MLNARVETFIQYQTALLGQVRNQLASAMPTRYVAMPPQETKPLPLRVDVKYYFGKEGEIFNLWICEINIAMISDLISLKHQRLPLAISSLDKRAIELTFTCSTSFNLEFST